MGCSGTVTTREEGLRRQLELTSRRLAAADERLVAFAGQVSHDLRNPLSAVRMSLELVREELGDHTEPGLVDLMERAERGIRRMDDMISDLITFARVGAVRDPAVVDLGPIVDEVVAEMVDATVAPDGAVPDISAVPQVEVGELPSLRGDADQLKVLFRNLLQNAVKFSPAGAPVTVSATSLPTGWRISVTDQGPGVPEEHRERVFDPMVRLDTRVPGTGVGLATCRRIVEAHGGRIGVTETADGGASLWFELPD